MQHLAIAQITACCSSTPIVLNTLTISMGILKVMRCYAPSPAPLKVALAKAIWCFVGRRRVCLIATKNPLDTALSLAETIRVSVAKVSISGLPRFTVSIGVAHHEGNESIDELFKRVDDALYRAKNDGRNRVLAA